MGTDTSQPVNKPLANPAKDPATQHKEPLLNQEEEKVQQQTNISGKQTTNIKSDQNGNGIDESKDNKATTSQQTQTNKQSSSPITQPSKPKPKPAPEPKLEPKPKPKIKPQAKPQSKTVQQNLSSQTTIIPQTNIKPQTNPYIDDDLIKAQKEFNPTKNKQFQQKYDIKDDNNNNKQTQVVSDTSNIQQNSIQIDNKNDKLKDNDDKHPQPKILTKPAPKKQKQKQVPTTAAPSVPSTYTPYQPDKPPANVKQKIEEYFHTSYPIHITEDVFNTERDLVRLRRYFHANPELSWEEIETGKNIIKYCESLGLITKSSIGKTGCVAVLHGKYGDGPCIGLRADMDALPIQEENNNIAYKSRISGKSHACGHDCHMAILLTVARILSQPKYVKQLHGCVKFIFQPAEEGGAGAKYMISDGVLDDDITDLNCPSVDQIYGAHVWSYCKLGKIILKNGPLMAGSTKFIIKIKGIGGHGAEPKNTADTVLATTQLSIQLHSIISRNLSPLENGVLTIGTMNVGTNNNIIAENGSITGTVRYLNNKTFELIKKRISSICDGIESSYNVSINIIWGINPYPPVINHSKNVLNVRNAVNKIFPINENCIIQNLTTMAAEDFSFFLNERPGCFFFIGCGVDEKIKKDININNTDDDDNDNKQNNDQFENKIYAHHTPKFRVDERCLIIGVQIFVNLIMDLLTNPNTNTNNDNDNDDDIKLKQINDYKGTSTTTQNASTSTDNDDNQVVDKIIDSNLP